MRTSLANVTSAALIAATGLMGVHVYATAGAAVLHHLHSTPAAVAPAPAAPATSYLDAWAVTYRLGAERAYDAYMSVCADDESRCAVALPSGQDDVAVHTATRVPTVALPEACTYAVPCAAQARAI